MYSILSTGAVAATLLSSAIAVPTKKTSTPKTCPAKSYNANFDDLTGIPTVALNPIPTPYDGLFFQGFDFNSVVQTGLLPGVVPHSGNNYAAAGVASETLGGTTMFTVNYPSSNVTSFDFESFYFGCSTNLANGATDPPAQCTVTFTGYKGNDNTVSDSTEVCSHEFQYNPSTLLGPAQMASSGTVSDCNGIQFAIITFTPPGGLSATADLLALVVDDVKYKTHSSSC